VAPDLTRSSNVRLIQYAASVRAVSPFMLREWSGGDAPMSGLITWKPFKPVEDMLLLGGGEMIVATVPKH
jgi:hypothetical protein